MEETKKKATQANKDKEPAAKKAASDKKEKASSVKPKAATKPKVDKTKKQIDELNKKVKKLEDTILNLENQNVQLKFENKKDIMDFQEKAKTFQSKAQEKINKFKAEFAIKQAEELVGIKKYGSQKMLESIIDSLLNLQMAIDAGSKQDDPSVNAYVMGFKMLMGQLYTSLEDNGVQVINPSIGAKFDPELHNAVTAGTNKAKIKEVKKQGFKLHDRVLKPAQVNLD